MNDLFAVSILARLESKSPVVTKHGACTVRAANVDEAYGKAMRICLKLYPVSAGWVLHHVVVNPISVIVEPENAVIT